MKRNFLVLSFLMVGAAVLAQQPNLNNSTKPTADTTQRPLDGYYKKSNLLNAKVTPYPTVREADVMYVKRVWREIDIRAKMNRIYASPKARLVDVIMDAVMAGELTAYDVVPTKDDPGGDKFSSILKPAQVMAKFTDSVLVPILDPATGEQTGTTLKAGVYNPDSVVKFRIKEDWIFDKQRSVMEPRIIGIAPMVKIRAGGQTLDDQPAFWIYFPEARHIFVTKEVVNRGNDATGLSYDDIFNKRIFDSYIVKESNPDDLRIKDYADGMDRLYESERVKRELFEYEHDLWSY